VWVEGALRRGDAKERKAAPQPGERLPYRLYRTSGGLEVRVGRSSKDNDKLTFRHAAHGDVWLHARSVPGSHVVLRWAEEGAPPARDLEEAATLAALYSKARTSGTVAVDWTRRKYVRKPRGAPPGRVTLINAKTLFVAPDPAVEERLRAEAG
jgi:predicted ribosome quality control (RQC) complex YloA/Tae2 family protein